MTDFSAFEKLTTKKYAHSLVLLSGVDSTNNYVKRMEDFLPDGTLVIAGEQLSGRGRQGKSFFSPSGSGLYMSLLVKDGKSVFCDLFTAKVCLAVCHAIDRITGTDCTNGIGIKWVNDIYFADKKLCGILCERLTGKDGKPYVVVGIGINLTLDRSVLPKELRNVCCSLFDITRTEYDVYKVAAVIAEEFEKIFDEKTDSRGVLEEYRRRSVVIGREITIFRENELVRAAALDICEDGALLVRYENGFTAKLCGGEISIRVKKQPNS